jgi:hypothetical protein
MVRASTQSFSWLFRAQAEIQVGEKVSERFEIHDRDKRTTDD